MYHVYSVVHQTFGILPSFVTLLRLRLQPVDSVVTRHLPNLWSDVMLTIDIGYCPNPSNGTKKTRKLGEMNRQSSQLFYCGLQSRCSWSYFPYKGLSIPIPFVAFRPLFIISAAHPVAYPLPNVWFAASHLNPNDIKSCLQRFFSYFLRYLFCRKSEKAAVRGPIGLPKGTSKGMQ